MIEIMKDLDPLFKTIFQEPFYGGSFYDDLKVGNPDEFDLDLLMVFSKIICQKHNTEKCSCVVVKPSNRPGFFWFKVDKNFYQPLSEKFIVHNYMRTDLILSWLKGLVSRALNQIRSIDSACVDYKPPRCSSQSGPAITLKLYGQFGHMNVDLVPAFKFGADYWTKQGYRSNPTDDKNDFFIVPKKTSGISKCERYWRASFPCQERQLINNKQQLKPALRLLKKMRNSLDHQISSYALKTIVLLDLESESSNWGDTLADSLMKLLKKYSDCLSKKKIAYYWNKGNNMLDVCNINDETLTNHYNEIAKKIEKIEREHVKDPFVVAKVILSEGSTEYEAFRENYRGDVIKAESTDISNIQSRNSSPSYYHDSDSSFDDNDDSYMQSSNDGTEGSYGSSSVSEATTSSDGFSSNIQSRNYCPSYYRDSDSSSDDSDDLSMQSSNGGAGASYGRSSVSQETTGYDLSLRTAQRKRKWNPQM